MNEDKAGEPFRPRILLDDASIPEAILRDPTLSVGARLLWGILAAYQRNGECSPLEEALAVDLGVKVRQLQSWRTTRGAIPQRQFPCSQCRGFGWRRTARPETLIRSLGSRSWGWPRRKRAPREGTW
jgi:hypothetical protein